MGCLSWATITQATVKAGRRQEGLSTTSKPFFNGLYHWATNLRKSSWLASALGAMLLWQFQAQCLGAYWPQLVGLRHFLKDRFTTTKINRSTTSRQPKQSSHPYLSCILWMTTYQSTTAEFFIRLWPETERGLKGWRFSITKWVDTPTATSYPTSVSAVLFLV